MSFMVNGSQAEMNVSTSQKKPLLFYVQPVLAGYRLPLVRALLTRFDLRIFADSKRYKKEGFVGGDGVTGVNDAPVMPFFGGRLLYQKGFLLNALIGRPEGVLIAANPRNISYWIILILARVLKIKVFSHGQGLYAYPHPKIMRRLIYRMMCRLSYKYICYADICRTSLLEIGCDPCSVLTINNSLELSVGVDADEKTYAEPGILFIGRVRHGSGLNILIEAMKDIRATGHEIDLHVIGGGDALLVERYKSLDWIKWHGAIADEHRIAEISRQCRVGCYPGSAGLSVVHMFSLSTPPLVHSNISSHMGPEPSYIKNGINGFLFEPGSNGLRKGILAIWNMNDSSLREIGRNAGATYRMLNTPPFSQKFVTMLSVELGVSS